MGQDTKVPTGKPRERQHQRGAVKDKQCRHSRQSSQKPKDEEPIQEQNNTHPELPRTSLFRDSLPAATRLPRKMRKRLIFVPDHVEEARRECTMQFIEQILFPLVAADEALTPIKLAALATAFKERFRCDYPEDFKGDLDLIASAELALMQIYQLAKTRGETDEAWARMRRLADRAARKLDELTEQDPDLYSV